MPHHAMTWAGYGVVAGAETAETSVKQWFLTYTRGARSQGVVEAIRRDATRIVWIPGIFQDEENP